MFAIAKSRDIKTYGTDPIVEPFVCDLKSLMTDKFEFKEIKFSCGLLAFLGDNLGSHTIGGFKESFSFAYCICRTCLATKEHSRTAFIASRFEARMPDKHKEHFQQIAGPSGNEMSVLSGVNRKTILESLPHFSVVTSMPHDIMHDLLEGVLAYEIKALLLYCIDRKYFSLSLLNERMKRFDYGYSENLNKPTVLLSKCRSENPSVSGTE